MSSMQLFCGVKRFIIFLLWLVSMDILAFNDVQSASIKELFEKRLKDDARTILEVNYVNDLKFANGFAI
jgi:hypothetical protein